jgi:transporter family-2 protein
MSDAARFLPLALLGIVAGVSFVVQQSVNAKLRADLGSPSWAAFWSYVGGTLTMAIVLLVTRTPWIASSALAKSAWWGWTGGFFGAVYMLPRLGAATVVALIVVGQMLASAAFDNAGAFGLARHPIDAARIAGAALLVVGVVLIRR